MKRFIRYLYEYENEKRIRNVGFIKVEAGYEETIVHLQAKGFHDWDERNLVLYLFYRGNDKNIRILPKELNLNSTVLSWRDSFNVEDVGGQEIYANINGIFIETGSGRKLAATWDDCCVDVSKIEEEKSLSVHTETKECEEERYEHKMEVQQEERNKSSVIKISRQDISKLPRCEWKLANNKFLMHGYNNFHYLLLIDDGNHLKLGVPGIYHIEEAKCADTFGFGEFISAEEIGMDSTDEEMFGYWCRPVRGGKNW